MGASASTQAHTPSSDSAAQCPVDHKTREIWLQQHKGSAQDAPHPIPVAPNRMTTSDAVGTKNQRPLSNDREISTIPRAIDPHTQSSSDSKSKNTQTPYGSASGSHMNPSNSEAETGHDAASGNWIYPSERQFFDALVRKSNVPGSTATAKELATSVASIIPIHNAVNEKAWSDILAWESRAPSSDPGSKKCGGPKLYSFRGLGTESQFVSPRARLNGLMGYQLPFDRHDWVVERCGGQRVEYVIDFYQGKQTASPSQQSGSGLTGASGPGKLSFYLDVRPKLNSFEGWRMRFWRFWGQ
ncbi:cytochrome c1 heme lyase [Talaromyces proteolyticus]|uniref:Holocytochrome c-type synthase n=1 Tax=Talaromyces proteolyticus TaxID=1131652 RepID=A0AAD4PY05_9EURO|nr:cytochrome c1 heme lyase [Talaromyces proteolyticus]KAH8697214.1 cytochrome c1 heme lyase [Talaromyces proteolyticus]